MNIPTIEQMIAVTETWYDEYAKEQVMSIDDVRILMKHFAEHHVIAALESSVDAPIIIEDLSPFGNYKPVKIIKPEEELYLVIVKGRMKRDKEVILKTYPLDNIK